MPAEIKTELDRIDQIQDQYTEGTDLDIIQDKIRYGPYDMDLIRARPARVPRVCHSFVWLSLPHGYILPCFLI